MPYITEELWQRLPGVGEHLLHPAYRGRSPTVMLATYPQGQAGATDEHAEDEMRAVIELISRVRNIRSEMNIRPSEQVPVLIAAPDEGRRAVFTSNVDQIARLARASHVTVRERLDAPRASAREREKLRQEATRLEAQLANPQFVERAPAEKVEDLRQRLGDITRRTSALDQILEALR
jgi:valyl-tRNA synthetase